MRSWAAWIAHYLFFFFSVQKRGEKKKRLLASSFIRCKQKTATLLTAPLSMSGSSELHDKLATQRRSRTSKQVDMAFRILPIHFLSTHNTTHSEQPAANRESKSQTENGKMPNRERVATALLYTCILSLSL